MELSEEGGTEVKDEVDTSPLLHHLERCSQDSSAEVGGGVAERTLEAVGPAGEVSVLRNDGHFVLVVGNDFSKLSLNKLGSSRLITKTLKDTSGVFELSLLDVVTWGLWEPEQSTGQDQGPEKLKGHWDTVRTRIQSVLGSVIDT